MRPLAFVLALLVLAAMVAATLVCGSVSIPLPEVLRVLTGGEASREIWTFIILQSRLPQALTAMLSGSALAVSGLLLQTAFRNPLADPAIFGISGGSGFGVALVMLLLGGSVSVAGSSLSGFAAILAGAFLGAMAVMGIILALSTVVRGDTTLLIAGIMVGYLTSSAISLLNFFATEEGVKSYLVWGMGNFGGVSLRQMPFFATVVLAGLTGAILLVKPLNALLLGSHYAANLGVRVRRLRFLLLLITGVLTAVVTAYCGPVAFIGLAVPHIARLFFPTDNQQVLVPATIFLGGIVALFCNLVCVLPGSMGTLPINAITPLVGAPVIIRFLVVRHRT